MGPLQDLVFLSGQEQQDHACPAVPQSMTVRACDPEIQVSSIMDGIPS